jgi:DNA-binding XRE family transcriptional regulator
MQTTPNLSPTTPTTPKHAAKKRPKFEAVEIVSAKIAGTMLKDVIRARKLTQEEVARRVGISYRQMNRLALKHSDPSLLLAARLATVLSVRPDELFKIQITTRSRVDRP